MLKLILNPAITFDWNRANFVEIMMSDSVGFTMKGGYFYTLYRRDVNYVISHTDCLHVEINYFYSLEKMLEDLIKEEFAEYMVIGNTPLFIKEEVKMTVGQMYHRGNELNSPVIIVKTGCNKYCLVNGNGYVRVGPLNRVDMEYHLGLHDYNLVSETCELVAKKV